MSKKLLLPGILLFSSLLSTAQHINKIIDSTEVKRIEKILSSDEFQGRKISTPGIDKAAEFIASEFKKNKLAFWGDLHTYKQDFSILKTILTSTTAYFDSKKIDSNSVIAITTQPDISITEKSDYHLARISGKNDLLKEAVTYIEDNKNYLVIVDTSHAKSFNKINRFKKEDITKNSNVIFILSPRIPLSYRVEINHSITQTKLTNIIGVIPGKNKKDEYVIFSGHYDHLGVGKPNNNADSIFNGANDDAAGITAVITLSKYFNTVKDNERTLVFIAFTAEETGGFGSKYFSSQINADKVVAMFNIEMIGTESKWGHNSAYITGYEKSDFGKILQKNLRNTAFNFKPDPYPSQYLFYRSDNAALAALGVPAHTISTSKMDNEIYYHTAEDEIETLDIKNMTAIIKAIAISSQTIVNAKDTPTRIENTSNIDQ
ncbi:MAG: M20/M25/M40 family metallo-hydrolase [Chitinophagaceae bacterium]|nr:M20/M25/M40 family metallo-hydrolase [Chitinophagaceae bacterium]